MEQVINVSYGQDMSDREKSVGQFLHRPWVQLAVVIMIFIILMILTIKMGISAWILASIGYERLVSGRGSPDFWEVGNELDEYKRSQAAPMAAQAGKEHLSGSVGSYDQARLTALLM